MKRIPKALTIAGSDSGGGAGIQADLKTFAALGVYGTSAITAVTAQNTLGVSRVLALSPALVAAQIDAVVEDIGAHALKTGMLANAKIVVTVARKIQHYRLQNLVVDPVMIAKSGDLLLRKDAVTALRSSLIPLATVVTPNLPEAEALTALRLTTPADLREAARRILAMGARSVVIKGGHRRGPAIDLFHDGKTFRELHGPRIRTRHTHGTGCTFSAAMTAYLATGINVERAAVLAKRFISQAILKAFAIGAGHSPVHHFFRLWRR
ncbi:MAG TPA: bifunctional hydroxymethylpyrimidine kinase/phosphomethylpyrimidine kinase [Terriglobales bacterium]|nr:bifunctional hydroxymethylpyrimidine kinase/phosphomethylpyrimidine kinase [Terriglobales bacterium]